MLKKFPELQTDDEAERFVATADLSEYDFSDFVPARFVFSDEPADAAVPLELSWSPELLRRIDARAERSGVSREDFIRRAVEQVLDDVAA